ncbi:hypothetical protein [Nitrosomonas sp. Nm166]|uniref:hypothetical protein n=1 Tax=Nitrosomonas sp. Nm166 TaxID=1881054 RepID=UPI003526006A
MPREAEWENAASRQDVHGCLAENNRFTHARPKSPFLLTIKKSSFKSMAILGNGRNQAIRLMRATTPPNPTRVNLCPSSGMKW